MSSKCVSFAIGVTKFQIEERSSVLLAQNLVSSLGFLATPRLVPLSLSERQLEARKKFLGKKEIIERIIAFGSSPEVLTCGLSPADLDTYSGKTLVKTPAVVCNVILVPKEREVVVGVTLAERWNKMQTDSEIKLAKLYPEKDFITSDWVGTLMRMNWDAFLEIVGKYTLESKPHEWDEWVGRNWRNLHGKGKRPDENKVSGGKVVGNWTIAPKDQYVGTPPVSEITVERAWEIAKTNSLALEKRSGYKKSWRVWDSKWKIVRR